MKKIERKKTPILKEKYTSLCCKKMQKTVVLINISPQGRLFQQW